MVKKLAVPIDALAATLPDFDDDAEAVKSLRLQAAADPVMDGDMNMAKPGEEDAWVSPGKWTGEWEDRRTGLPINCPIVPLGKNEALFYFLNTLGQVETLKPNAGKGDIDSLFSGRGRYLFWAWPRFTQIKKETETTPAVWTVKNFEAEQARQALFAACAFKGTFELEDRVRGRGAWRDDDDKLIYHAGDAVMIAGKWRPPGEHGRFIYPGRPTVARPSARYESAGEGSPGDVLLEALRSWNWDRGELDARLALGWLMTAMVGGALRQRPSIFVIGTEGAGKSTLLNLFQIVMAGGLVKTGNTTQAGIYQKVRQDSVAVIVDEMADKEDQRNADKILELARVAYSGDKMNRGGKDGVGVEFAVMSSFLFSTIGLPAMDSQDASRMAVLMMRERVRPAASEKPVDALRELGLREGKKAEAIGRQLLRRMFDWFERWDGLRQVFHDMMTSAGHQDRAADTFSALAAGYHVAICDEMPSAGQLAEWSTWLAPAKLEETAGREMSWERCFWYLMGAQPEALRNNHYKSVGAAVEAYGRSADALRDLTDVLGLCGMAVSFGKGAVVGAYEEARLFVPFNSPALNALFEGSKYEGKKGAPGPWGSLLRQMPRTYFTVSTCDKGLNKAARGLMINLSAVLKANGEKADVH